MKLRVYALLSIIILISILIYLNFSNHKTFYYAGTVEATEITLSSRINAVIEQINAREGDKIKKDAVIARLSCEDIKVAYESAKRDYDRAQKLLNAGSLNQEAFDRIRFKMDDLTVRLGWSIIKAPLNSTVISLYHEPGEMVLPGTKIFLLADLTRVWAYIYVPHPVLSKISLQQRVTGFVEDSEMKTIEGFVTHINNEAEFTPKNVQTSKERTRLVYGVKIEFDNKDLFLKPGMTVNIKLTE